MVDKEKQSVRRHCCAYCGKDMGPYDKYACAGDTCGERECERWARDNVYAEREEAHERLDRDMGWGEY